MKRKRDTTTNVKHAESIEIVEKEKKRKSTAVLPNSNKKLIFKKTKKTKNDKKCPVQERLCKSLGGTTALYC